MRTSSSNLVQGLRGAILLATLAATTSVHAQSIGGESVFSPTDPQSGRFNPYIDHTGKSTGAYLPTMKTYYDGEYMLLLDNHRWGDVAENEPERFSFTVELVSFPFFPTTPPSSSSTVRNLALPTAPFTAWPAGDGWTMPRVGGTYPLWRKFTTGAQIVEMTRPEGAPPGKVLAISAYRDNLGFAMSTPDNPMSLVSNFFEDSTYCSGALPEPGRRTHLPHSIFRITISVHTGPWKSTPVADSLSFVVDNTRGRMRQYPFAAANCAGSGNAPSHDVTVFPSDKYPAHSTYNNSQNELGTIDYYKYQDKPLVNGFSPPPGGRDALADKEIPAFEHVVTADYLHYPPYTVTGASLRGIDGRYPVGYAQSEPKTLYKLGGTAGGLPHTYYINTDFDLRLLGREVFNPSAVTVQSHLTFPEGYIFRTIRGVYPTSQQVIQANGGLTTNLTQVSVPTDLAAPSTDASVYYLAPGSSIKIEQCVKIWDAKFVIAPGASMTILGAPGGRYVIDDGGDPNRVSRPRVIPVDCSKYK